VEWRLPFGRLARLLPVRRQLKLTFDYRGRTVAGMFGSDEGTEAS
jgi:hypothetical protein